MSEVDLSLKLRHRELYGNLPQLFAIVEDFHKLVRENYKEIHDERISEILLWIAINHPEMLKNDSKFLCSYSVTNLCFRDSYEKPDNLVPTEALTTLLNSDICRKVEKFCGYIDPQILNMDSLDLGYVDNMKLAIGRDNMYLFFPIPSFVDEHVGLMTLDIHLVCGELSHEDLALFPVLPNCDGQSIYISDVSDKDVCWVLLASEAVNQMKSSCSMKFKRSKLTATGFEDIAKVLPELEGGRQWSLGVSSPNIPEFWESGTYFERISLLYNMECYFLDLDEFDVSLTPELPQYLDTSADLTDSLL